MPYTGPDDPTLPDHVQEMSEDKRRRWIAVFERVLEETGDEGEAMAAANAAVQDGTSEKTAPMAETAAQASDDIPDSDQTDGEHREQSSPDAGSDELPTTAVKALDDDGRVGGYLVVWGGPDRRDLQGEYFTPDTDLGLDWYPTRPVLYHHGLDGQLGPVMMGQIKSLQPDETGVWVEAQLDLRSRWAQAVLDLVKRGALGWSSGSLPHLVAVAADGHIRRWPVVEGSLTPAPAEPRHTGAVAKHYCDSEVVQAAYKSAGLDLPDVLKRDSAAESEAVTEHEEPVDVQDAVQIETNDDKHTPPPQEAATEDTTMPGEGSETTPGVVTKEAVLALLQEHEDQKAAERQQAELEAKAAHYDELLPELETLRAQAAQQAAEPARRLPGHTGEPEERDDPTLTALAATTGKAAPVHITVGSPYDKLDAVDLAFGVDLLKAMRRMDADKGRVSEPYAHALAAKTWLAGFRPLRADGTAYKADELAHSTQVNFGDEWVPDLWNNELWLRARNENVVLPLFRAIEMPSATFELPVEGTDPTVHYVPETTDESQLTLDSANNPTPSSKVGSGKVTLTAHKLALRVGFSAELTEDSLLPILPVYRAQALRAMADAIDHVLLNGDVEAGATGNVNSDDQPPGATQKYLAFDGLRKLPLVTTPDQAVDADGGPTLALLRRARFAMPMRYSLRPRDLAWIVDGATYGKLLGLNEVATIDKFGPQATVLTGEVAKVDGIPVLASAEYGLTEADGKISTATPANNTKGQAVCVYRPGWVVGYRRRIATAVVYLPYYDAYQLVATLRLAFVRFDPTVASVLYDITV